MVEIFTSLIDFGNDEKIKKIIKMKKITVFILMLVSVSSKAIGLRMNTGDIEIDKGSAFWSYEHIEKSAEVDCTAALKNEKMKSLINLLVLPLTSYVFFECFQFGMTIPMSNWEVNTSINSNNYLVWNGITDTLKLH